MSKVTVIVPVYNMQKYLKECLDSLVNQSYNNVEIILVDDGSTDGSYDICKDYADNNDSIVLLHKENGGGGSARNTALEIATGDYVLFVDSDDWITLDACEKLMRYALEYNADVIHCEVFKDSKRQRKIEPDEVRVLSKKEVLETMLNDRVRSGALKMFKREIVGRVRFPLHSSIDDMVFFSNIIENVKTMVVTDMELYFYRYNRSDSMSNSPERFVRNVFERFEEFSNRYEIANRNKVYGEEAFEKAIEHGLVFYAHFEVGNEWEEQRKQVIAYLKNNIKHILKCPVISKRDKMKCMFLLLNKDVYTAIVKILAKRRHKR